MYIVVYILVYIVVHIVVHIDEYIAYICRSIPLGPQGLSTESPLNRNFSSINSSI